MNQQEKYKVIFWDFDGVIMDSMSIRDKGFEEVLKDYPKDQVNSLMQYHRENGGLSRYVKFRYFFEVIRKEEISDEQVQFFAKQFSAIMLSLLVDDKLLISDSVNFIKTNGDNYHMHIVSGSDEKELNHICKELNLSKHFTSIHGSPTPKIELVKNIIEKYNYSLDECILIGDSKNDYEAAEKNGITFYAYNNPAFIEKYLYIHTFNDFQL